MIYFIPGALLALVLLDDLAWILRSKLKTTTPRKFGR